MAERILADLAGALDRALPVPLGVQLRGLVEYGIALGELPPGQRLPSVRELALRAGIAPMTVATVYRELREAGLIEARPGAGTFVAETGDAGRTAAMRKLQARVDALFAEAEQHGLPPAVVASLVNARAARGRAPSSSPPPARPLRIVIVGVFAEATRFYAECVAAHLASGDVVLSTTIGELQAGAPFPLPCDVCVTIANRRGEVETLIPAGMPLVGLSFIPAEATRARLAAIDPMARIGIVSVFPEFLAMMKPGVLRFTPHVDEVGVRLLDDADLDAFLGSVDVAIYASGAEAILQRLPPGRQAIEYRHVPDPHTIRRNLLPVLERLRGGETSGADRDRADSPDRVNPLQIQ